MKNDHMPMTARDLRVELYEIQGCLWIITSAYIPNIYFSGFFFLHGCLTIIFAFVKAIKIIHTEKKEAAKCKLKSTVS